MSNRRNRFSRTLSRPATLPSPPSTTPSYNDKPSLSPHDRQGHDGGIPRESDRSERTVKQLELENARLKLKCNIKKLEFKNISLELENDRLGKKPCPQVDVDADISTPSISTVSTAFAKSRDESIDTSNARIKSLKQNVHNNDLVNDNTRLQDRNLQLETLIDEVRRIHREEKKALENDFQDKLAKLCHDHKHLFQTVQENHENSLQGLAQLRQANDQQHRTHEEDIQALRNDLAGSNTRVNELQTALGTQTDRIQTLKDEHERTLAEFRKLQLDDHRTVCAENAALQEIVTELTAGQAKAQNDIAALQVTQVQTDARVVALTRDLHNSQVIIIRLTDEATEFAGTVETLQTDVHGLGERTRQLEEAVERVENIVTSYDQRLINVESTLDRADEAVWLHILLRSNWRARPYQGSAASTTTGIEERRARKLCLVRKWNNGVVTDL
ncbi:hypothetical protein C7999DRAFT_36338 [Corynascus novoguineensis]|uniref:Uncharacterized protein n=1 Tax=Corynascus novoguineensis TaxID=1126955 RepID=A0AAN7CJN2_9PEZI|nr:hypothetical protein C7999DRAFT_36338 [Corynascus novoguineensis]